MALIRGKWSGVDEIDEVHENKEQAGGSEEEIINELLLSSLWAQCVLVASAVNGWEIHSSACVVFC